MKPVTGSMDDARKKTAEQMLKSHEERKRLLNAHQVSKGGGTMETST